MHLLLNMVNIMDVLKLFLTYAADFEITYKDDNWDRLHQYFNDQAIYEIVSPSMPCTLTSPTEIFRGIKKSLDGFDRRYDSREIAIGNDLKTDDSTLSASWSVTYIKGELPPFVLKGKSVCTFRDNKIEKLVDTFDAQNEQALMDWVTQTGFNVDPSYV